MNEQDLKQVAPTNLPNSENTNTDQVNLQELFAVVKENNHILRKLRMHQRIQTVTRIIQFLFVLGLFGASYYFIQPYLEKVMELYSQVQTTAQTANEFKTTLQGSWADFFKQ